MSLTSDQRWLLRSVGGWAMRECLIGPAGVDHLMTSMLAQELIADFINLYETKQDKNA